MGIKRRSRTTYVSGGWQAYVGPGVLRRAVFNGTSLSSNVLTLYDSPDGNTADKTVATWTEDDDFGTTVPATVFRDGSVVATMATESANTHLGLPFFDGLFANKTGDTTNNLALDFLISPLIKKTLNLGHGAAGDDQAAFDGPGIVHAIRVHLDQAADALATLDLTLEDSLNGGVILTATNFATGGWTTWYPVTTTGEDDAGTAVTTAATGAYTNDGVAFLTGLNVAVVQGATTRNAKVELLIEG